MVCRWHPRCAPYASVDGSMVLLKHWPIVPDSVVLYAKEREVSSDARSSTPWACPMLRSLAGATKNSPPPRYVPQQHALRVDSVANAGADTRAPWLITHVSTLPPTPSGGCLVRHHQPQVLASWRVGRISHREPLPVGVSYHIHPPAPTPREGNERALPKQKELVLLVTAGGGGGRCSWGIVQTLV